MRDITEIPSNLKENPATKEVQSDVACSAIP